MGQLAGQTNLRQADRIVSNDGGEWATHFKMDHRQPFDFVYVDGPVSEPPAELKGSKDIKDPKGYMPNMDVELFWRNGIFPKVIVIDGRRATVRRLIETSGGKYAVYLKTDYYFNANLQRTGPFRFHTVLVLKDGIY